MSRETSRGMASVLLVCEVFGLSRAAYYAGLKRVRAAGVTGAKRVQRAVRQQRGPVAAAAEAVLAAIRIVVVENPAYGVRKVWAMLRREHDLRVSKRRVWAIMHAHGLVLSASARDIVPVPRGHVTTELPNRRLATDMTLAWTRQDGWVGIFPTVDCGCRSVLGLVVAVQQDAATALASVRMALQAAFGSPRDVPEGVELRTDHGAVYTGGDCRELCEAWNLEHTFSPIGRPTGNAVVERVNRTLKEEVVWLRDWETAAELRAALMAWVDQYNRRRPHQALGYATPAEYRAAKLAAPIAEAA